MIKLNALSIMLMLIHSPGLYSILKFSAKHHWACQVNLDSPTHMANMNYYLLFYLVFVEKRESNKIVL